MFSGDQYEECRVNSSHTDQIEMNQTGSEKQVSVNRMSVPN